MTQREEIIGDARLILGDCREVIPTINRVDAVVTDPPYGINEAAGKNVSRGYLAKAKDYGNENWDREPVSPELIKLVVASGKYSIIFGGNYYELPPTSCWLVWDKENGAIDIERSSSRESRSAWIERAIMAQIAKKAPYRRKTDG